MTGGFTGRFWSDVNLLDSARAYSEAEGWVDFPPLPSPTFWHCQVTVGHTVYVIGGRSEAVGGVPPIMVDSVYTISDDHQQWVKIANLPTEISSHACAVMGPKIYVIGGTKNRDILASVYILDTSSPGSSWELGPQLPAPRTGSQAFVYQNLLYLVGGANDGGAAVDVYTLASDAQSWNVVNGPVVDEHLRRIFPAPLIDSNSMVCS